jgi:hypothetical protein
LPLPIADRLRYSPQSLSESGTWRRKCRTRGLHRH